MQYQKFNEVYKLLLNEDVSTNVIHNLNNKKMNDNDDESNKSLTDIDELTEENMTTIEEDSNIDEQDEQDESGWNEVIENICSEIIYKFDGFAYELKNCNKGSFTNAKDVNGLIDYLENLKNDIDVVIDQLQNM